MIITRVYNNGERLTQRLTDSEGDAELECSKRMRPGCALFRNSECVQEGYLGPERCAAISEELKLNQKGK